MQSLPPNVPASTGAPELTPGVDHSSAGGDQPDTARVMEAIKGLLGRLSDVSGKGAAARLQNQPEVGSSKTAPPDPKPGSGEAKAAAGSKARELAEPAEAEASAPQPEPAPEPEPEPAFVPNDRMETLSTLAKHMDKVPDGLRKEYLDGLAHDESLPQDLREAYAALRDDPELYDKLDSADKAGGLSGSRSDGNDGNAGHGDLRKAFNDPEFVQYNRDKSAAYTESYIPSDAGEGDMAPRAMTESDAARELYLYSDSLPDNIDDKALQQIVDGQVNGKCPAQLQAAAQYMLDHPESFDKLATDGSCSRGELQNNAAPLINLREEELSALDTLKNNKDCFFRDGNITRDTLTDLAADESVPDDVRQAAATLRESDVVFGMLDNGDKGHVEKNAWIKKRGNKANDGSISGDDVNALLDKKLSEANRTPPPAPSGGADGGKAQFVVNTMLINDMMAGWADDPETKKARGGQQGLAKALNVVGKVLDGVKTGLDALAGALPPPFGAIVAAVSTGVGAANNFGVKAGAAMLNGVPRAEAMKTAAKNFAFDAAASAASAIPGAGAAAKGAVMAAKQAAMAGAREAGETVVREGAEAGLRKGAQEAAETGGEMAAKRGAGGAGREAGEAGAREGGETSFKQGVKDTVKDTLNEEANVQVQTVVSDKLGIEVGESAESEDGEASGGKPGKRRGHRGLGGDDGADKAPKAEHTEHSNRSENDAGRDPKKTDKSDKSGESHNKPETKAEREARREEEAAQREEQAQAERQAGTIVPLAAWLKLPEEPKVMAGAHQAKG